jgi:tRNA pseudouridine55 synthase
MTSFDVVAYLRKVLKTKKIGHTGTLDPGAAGVLPVCVGHATKAIEFITDKEKSYRAELMLGVSTDTQDAFGKVLSKEEVAASQSEVVQAVKSFIGKYQQLPPMYSAVKVGGKKLYELARNGITVERKTRDVEIYSIDIIDIELPRVLFQVECSKGTYIRTLCADIGEKLGCGGHMSFLVRTAAGIFNISESVTLEEVEEFSQKNKLRDLFINVEKVFQGFESIVLDKQSEIKLVNGAFIKLSQLNFELEQLVRVYNSEGNFIALGEVFSKQKNWLLKSRKLFDGGISNGSNL